MSNDSGSRDEDDDDARAAAPKARPRSSARPPRKSVAPRSRSATPTPTPPSIGDATPRPSKARPSKSPGRKSDRVRNVRTKGDPTAGPAQRGGDRGESLAAGTAPHPIDRREPRESESESELIVPGLGPRLPRGEVFRRALGIALVLCLLACVVVLARIALAPTDRAAPPDTVAETAAPAFPPSLPVVPRPPAPLAISLPPGPSAAPAIKVVSLPPAQTPAQPVAAAVSAAPPTAASRPSAASAPTVAASVPSPVVPATPTAPASPSASSAASEPSAGDGFLNINSLPASLVVLDGKPIGSTPKVHVQVTAGAHTVVFTNSELGVMKEVVVTVAAGETTLASARLRD